MPTYLQCGLRMRSEIEMALPLAPGDGFDVDVRWGADILDTSAPPAGEVIASYGEGDGAWYTVTERTSGYLVRFRNCGEFVLTSDLDEIEVRRDPAGRHELLPILLAGTVSAILLTLRGSTVLHASAVLIDDQAMAFVGQSGRGKSTLAALMCIGGSKLVTDDVLVVEAGPPPVCIGGASELRLREKAFEIAGMRPGAPTRETADDRLAFMPESASSESFPLSAIIIPEPSRTATDVEIEQVSPSDSLFALLSFPRVHRWSRPGVLSQEFTTLSGLVNTVPVYRATVPWGPPFSTDIAPALAALV